MRKMFNINLCLNTNKVRNKQLRKNNELVTYLVFYLISKQLDCVNITKSNKKKIKMLLVSPFHYKVAKKLIRQINTAIIFNVSIVTKKTPCLSYLFRYNGINIPINTILFYKKMNLIYIK